MAKGFMGGLLKAFFVAIIAFFLVYFFAPHAASRFLGTSFRDRGANASAPLDEALASVGEKLAKSGVVSALASKAATATDGEFVSSLRDVVEGVLADVGELTESGRKRLEEKLSDPETLQRLKSALSEGGDGRSLKALLSLVEEVR